MAVFRIIFMQLSRVLPVLCLVAWWGSGPVSNCSAADLVRGPYLQTATPTSIRFCWRTDEPTESIVLYGTEPNNLHLIAGDLDLTTEHEIDVYGLVPATQYFYGVGSLGGALAEG